LPSTAVLCLPDAPGTRCNQPPPPCSRLLCRWERRQIFERLDELREDIDSATEKTCSHLLDAADVVGVTCTGAAGPELAGFAFDLVVIDEGSQASE